MEKPTSEELRGQPMRLEEEAAGSGRPKWALRGLAGDKLQDLKAKERQVLASPADPHPGGGTHQMQQPRFLDSVLSESRAFRSLPPKGLNTRVNENILCSTRIP